MIYWVLLYLLIVGSMLHVIFIIGFPDILYDILGFAVSPELTKIINYRTPKQTPHFDTRSEINPSRTLVKNEIMKTLKSAPNIGNRARKCIWHCLSCEMGYLSTRLRYFGDLC